MTISADRAAFIKNEFRYATSSDSSVLTRDKTAQTLEVTSNINGAAAGALASTILAQNNTARIYTVQLDGIMTVDDFVGGVPRFVANMPNFATDGRTQRAINFTCDLNSGLTTVRIHG